jgi:hypothetical protein
VKPRDTGNVVNPMDALRKSLSTPASAVPRNQQKAGSRTPQPASREMLVTISGKGDGKPAAKETERPKGTTP